MHAHARLGCLLRSNLLDLLILRIHKAIIRDVTVLEGVLPVQVTASLLALVPCVICGLASGVEHAKLFCFEFL